MKLCRFQYQHVVRTGCVVGDAIKPLDQLIPERASDNVCRDMRALLTGGAALLEEIRAGLADNRGDTIPLASVRLLAPIDTPPIVTGAPVSFSVAYQSITPGTLATAPADGSIEISVSGS